LKNGEKGSIGKRGDNGKLREVPCYESAFKKRRGSKSACLLLRGRLVKKKKKLYYNARQRDHVVANGRGRFSGYVVKEGRAHRKAAEER